MSKPFNTHLSRRAFVSNSLAGAAAALTPVIPQAARAAPGLREFPLTAAKGQAALLSAPYAATDIWGYGGLVPGGDRRKTLWEARSGVSFFGQVWDPVAADRGAPARLAGWFLPLEQL